MKFKILVTGCCGFVGVNCTERFLLEGHDCIGIDIENSEVSSTYEKLQRRKRLEEIGDGKNGRGKFIFIKCDIRKSAEVLLVMQKYQPNRIFHSAALVMDRRSVNEPHEYITTNVIGTQNIFDAIHEVKSVDHIVLASTRSVIGEAANNNPNSKVNALSIPCPTNPYGASKAAMEAIAHAYHNVYGLSITSLRFQPMYGPYCRSDMAVKRLFDSLFLKKSFYKFGHGNATRDWLYIEDAAEAVYNAIKTKLDKFSIFSIGTGVATSLDELINCIQNIGKNDNLTLDIVESKTVAGDAVHGGVADITSAKIELNWTPQVELEEGILRTYNYFKQFYKDQKVIPIGLVGVGIFANKAHGPALSRLACCDLVAVCSQNIDRRTSFAKEYVVELDLLSSYGNYNQFIKCEKFTAIDLVVPTPIISNMIYKALYANKHVLSEKPIANTYSEATNLYMNYENLRKQNKTAPIWCVSENWRLEQSFIDAMNAIKTLGELKSVNCTCAIERSRESAYVKNKWRSKDQRYWLKDIGVHLIAALRLLFSEYLKDDEEQLKVKSVNMLFTSFPSKRESITSLLEIPGLIIPCNLSMTYDLRNVYIKDSFREQFEIIGQNGKIVVSRKSLSIWDSNGMQLLTKNYNIFTVDKAIELFSSTVYDGILKDNHPLHPKQALEDLRIVEKISMEVDILQAQQEQYIERI